MLLQLIDMATIKEVRTGKNEICVKGRSGIEWCRRHLRDGIYDLYSMVSTALMAILVTMGRLRFKKIARAVELAEQR